MDGQQVAVKLSRKSERFSYRWSEHPTYGFVNNDVITMDIARHENVIALLDVFSDETYLYAVSLPPLIAPLGANLTPWVYYRCKSFMAPFRLLAQRRNMNV